MEKKYISAIAIINLLSFFVSLSYEMVFTVMPFFLVNVLGVSMIVIGLIEGGYDLITNFVKIFAGYWSDFSSKRKFLLFGVIFSILSRIYFIFGKKWEDIFIGVLLESTSEGIQVPVSDAILSSEKKKSLGKIFGINRAIESFGALFGILIAFIYSAFFLNSITYQAYFWISVIPFLICILLIFLITEKKEKKYPIKIVSWEIFFPKYLILFFILSFANFGYSFYILKIYKNLNNEAYSIGMYVIFSIIITVASYLSGKFYDRVGEKKFLEITIILFFISHLFMVIFPIIGFIIFSVADAFLEIGIWATVGKRVKFRKGFVFGTYHFTVGFSSLIAGLVAGYLWDRFSSESPFIMGSIASIFAYFLIKRYF